MDLLPKDIYSEEDKTIKAIILHDFVIGDLPRFLHPSGGREVILKNKAFTSTFPHLIFVAEDMASEVDVGVGGLLPEDREEGEAEDLQGDVDDGGDDEAGNPSSSSTSGRRRAFR